MSSTFYSRCIPLLIEEAQESSTALYVVGGAIRDALLHSSSSDADLDLVVEADAGIFLKTALSKLQQHFDRELKVLTFEKFKTAKLSLEGEQEETIDFASTRKESYPQPGGAPQVELASLEEDLRRRDFTINSIALPLHNFSDFQQDPKALSERLVDPYSGQLDLGAGLLRVHHDKSFDDDPSRIVRAARYAVLCKCQLETETFSFMKGSLEAGALKAIDLNRFWLEWKRCIHLAEGELGVLLKLKSYDFFQHWEVGSRHIQDSDLEKLVGLVEQESSSKSREVLWSAFLAYSFEEPKFFSFLRVKKSFRKKLARLFESREDYSLESFLSMIADLLAAAATKE